MFESNSKLDFKGVVITDDMIWEIQQYFLDKRDEDLSNLESGRILNFVLEKLAVEFYNQGVYDSCKYMRDRVEDVLSIQKY